ncbi:pentapeptide repeat-containing protein [Nostoc sp. UIC 10890]
MSRDYYKSNLRGSSFKDKDLKNANFSKADIRGVDFTNADLTGAIFKEAKISGTNFYDANLTGAILDNAVCGVKIWWSIIIFIISLFIISLSGFSASIIISCNFYFFLGIRGINKIIYTILISVVYISFFHAYFLNSLFHIQQSYLIYMGICIIFLVGVFIPFIETMDEPKTENMQIFLSIIFFSIIVVLVNIILINTNLDPIIRRAIGAFFGSLLGIVISDQAIINKEKKYVWIWNLFVYFASVQGTKFHHSNLKDVSFANVNLKGSNFSECTLTRTNWYEVKKIDCARIQVNYLENSIIRDLLIKKRTRKEKDYQGMDLRELNLVGATLDSVNLSRADLSNSQLIEANLENSILNQTKLDNVDLRRANITGVTIEKGSIPATAQLDGLICDYFYFYPQPNLKQRHPTTGKLTSEEAITLLQKPSQVSIVFEQDGIDWQVFLQVFENCLKEFNISPDNSDNLIQAFESRLNGNFVIRLNVPINVNKVEFEQRLKQAYNNGIEDLKRQYRNTLQTTNIDFQNNTSMFKITRQLANPGNLIIQNIVTTGNNSMTNNPGGISQNVSGGSVYGGMQAAQGNNNVQTSTTYSLPEQEQTLAEAAAEIQQLLDQLSQSYPTDTMSGKMALATEATQRIENNPTLMQKTISALRAGGTAALEQALSHPAASFVIAALDDWNKNNQ